MQSEYPFHTAFLFLFMAVVGVRLYYHGFADAASGVRQHTKGEGAFRIIRYLLGGPLLAAFALYMIWPPLMQWAQFSLSSEVRWIGFALGIVSVCMLRWIHRHLSRNFTGTVQIRPGGHVVTTGPYKYVRHPMYIAFLTLGTGILLLTSNWFLGGGLLLIFLIVIVVRTPIEEHALEKQYGDAYRAYKKRTGAMFPRLF